MGKLAGCGQAAILSDFEIASLRRAFQNPTQRLLFDIGVYTGERWGAICQLRVMDVYTSEGKVREEVTFQACSRKHRPDGTSETRQVHCHPRLAESLGNFIRPNSPWLFRRERDTFTPIPWDTADGWLRNAVARAGLCDRGISTHSTRRTFITSLYRKGVDLKVLQRLTGHRNLTTLLRYVEASEEQMEAAINLL
jgi:integrase/recombinase XerD